MQPKVDQGVSALGACSGDRIRDAICLHLIGIDEPP